MKYTIKEFAKEIRKLYPEDYNDLTDEKMVELWMKKYPSDRDKIDFNNEVKSKVQTSEPSNSGTGSSFGFLKTIFWLGLIGGGIYLFYNYNNINYTSSSSNNGNPSVENNYSPEVTVDPTFVDTSVINTEPLVEDAAGILMSQTNDNSNIIDNSNNSSNDISAQDIENMISKGLDIISYLSKSNQWEKKDFAYKCSECGEGCEMTVYYKETTDEVAPIGQFPKTPWYSPHTHQWVRLK